MDQRESYRQGMAAYHAGRYEKAIELLTPLSQSGGGPVQVLGRYYLGQAHYHLAMRLFGERRYREASRHFQWAAGLNSVGGAFARFLVACYVGGKQFDMAARELEAMLRREPDNVELRIRLALAQCRLGAPLEAIATLREGLLTQPYEAEFHYQIGVIFAAQENWTEAENSFELAIACRPDHAQAHERLAQIHALHGRHEQAIAFLHKAHRLDPGNARIAFQLSLAAMSLPADRPGGEVSLETGPAAPMDESALDRLSQALIEEPDFITSFLALPESEIDQEVFSTLAATLERALARHPEYADLHYHCGQVYRRLGRRMEAIAEAERAVRLNPRYVNALVLLAELYAQTDQWAMGVERLEQAIAAGADYPDVHYLLGRLYRAGGRIPQARKAFRRALEINRNYTVAQEALAALPH